MEPAIKIGCSIVPIVTTIAICIQKRLTLAETTSGRGIRYRHQSAAIALPSASKWLLVGMLMVIGSV